MTGRGAPKVPQRPVTPPDQTLQSRPVPRFRQYTPRSFGSGVAANFPTLTTSLGPQGSNRDEVLRLLEHHQSATSTSWREDGYLDPDPCWGFYVFRTAYSAAITDEQVELAMENLVKVQHRALQQYTESKHVEGATQLFRLNLIESKETLADASDDRVREEFRAVIRSLRLAEDEARFPPPARNNACMKLDELAVEMLAELDLSDDLSRSHMHLKDKTIRMVDIHWHRPQSEMSVWGCTGPGYRGVMDVSIVSLLHFYTDMTWDANHMMEMHPATESS